MYSRISSMVRPELRREIASALDVSKLTARSTKFDSTTSFESGKGRKAIEVLQEMLRSRNVFSFPLLARRAITEGNEGMYRVNIGMEGRDWRCFEGISWGEVM